LAVDGFVLAKLAYPDVFSSRWVEVVGILLLEASLSGGKLVDSTGFSRTRLLGGKLITMLILSKLRCL